MSFNLRVLQLKKPEVAKAIQEWQAQYENRSLKLDPVQETEFNEAIAKLVTHLCQTSKTVEIRTVVGQEGLETIYFEVTPRKT